jgi:Sel1 repeat
MIRFRANRHYGVILTNQNQPVPEPPVVVLDRLRDVLRRNPVALVILVILSIGFLRLLSMGSGPNSSGSVPTYSNTQPAQWYEDASAAYNRGDFAAVIGIIRPFADQGNAKAQDFLGLMYAEGHGVHQDYTEAMKWRRRAADQGDAGAQIDVGLMYRDGQGIGQDNIRAYMWNTLATRSSDSATAELASMGREDIARHMTAAQIAEAQTMASEWKPGPPR